MAQALSVFIAFSVHFLLRVSIFLDQQQQSCSAAPEIASIMYLCALLLILLDNEVLPGKYRKIPFFYRVTTEAIISIIIMEFGTIVIWCSLEKTTYSMLRCMLFEGSHNIYHDIGGDFLVGVLINIISLIFLYQVAVATNFYKKILNVYVEMKLAIKDKRAFGCEEEMCLRAYGPDSEEEMQGSDEEEFPVINRYNLRSQSRNYPRRFM